jgi:hypothetical protein
VKDQVAEKPERQPYEPPRATFVPLQVEERLMACAKLPTFCKASLPANQS